MKLTMGSDSMLISDHVVGSKVKRKKSSFCFGKTLCQSYPKVQAQFGVSCAQEHPCRLGNSGKSASASVGTLENLNAPQEDMP